MNLTINGSAVELDDRHAKTPLHWVLREVVESNPAPDAAQITLWMNGNVVPKKHGANQLGCGEGLSRRAGGYASYVHP